MVGGQIGYRSAGTRLEALGHFHLSSLFITQLTFAHVLQTCDSTPKFIMVWFGGNFVFIYVLLVVISLMSPGLFLRNAHGKCLFKRGCTVQAVWC